MVDPCCISEAMLWYCCYWALRGEKKLHAWCIAGGGAAEGAFWVADRGVWEQNR